MTQAKLQDPLINKEIQGGRYYLQIPMGHRACIRCYKALDQQLSSPDSPIHRFVKILTVNLSTRPGTRQQFQQFMQACSQISDERILPILDFGVVPLKYQGQVVEFPFVVREVPKGKTLADVLEEQIHLSPDQAIRIIRQLSSPLEILHRGVNLQGKTIRFLYRDLHPSTIFLLADTLGTERLQVDEFVTVKFLDTFYQGIVNEERLGHPPLYRAPEYYQSHPQVDGRSDIYSLGCIFYEMLSGHNPFGLLPTSPLSSWIQAHQSSPPIPFATDLRIPKSLETLVFRCLQKDPQSRFATIRELEIALRKEQQEIEDIPQPIPSLRYRKSDPVLMASLVAEEIIDFLETALGHDLTIHLTQTDKTLDITLVRHSSKPLNYQVVTQTIIQQIQSLCLPGVEQLSLHSRSQDTDTPDWHKTISLLNKEDTPKPIDTPPIQNQKLSTELELDSLSSIDFPVGADKEILNPINLSATELEVLPDLDLKQYCFVRNPMLLKTTLPAPTTDIAQATLFFHDLSNIDKLQVLPVLVKFFKDPSRVDYTDLSPTLREWLMELKALNDQKLKTVAVWLSRYCEDPIKTLPELSKAIDTAQQAALQQQEVESSIRSGSKSDLKGEKPIILYRARSHWILGVIQATLGLAGLTLGILMLPQVQPQRLKPITKVFLAAPLILAIQSLFYQRRSTLSLTQSQVFIQNRFLLKQENIKVFLDQIQEIKVDKDGLGQSLGYGAITLTTKQEIYKFPWIEDADEFKKQVAFIREQKPLQTQDPMAGSKGSAMTLSVGATLGNNRYRLEKLIGTGGMGRVYKATDQRLSMQVAIKFMLGGQDASPDQKERFQREMKACISLQDARIVKVLDYGTAEDNTLFLVMEYISAPTLDSVLQKSQRFSVPRAMNAARQIAAALQIVHQGVMIQGKRVQFVHRDLKPSNVFLLKDASGEESIKLADFGLVKFQGGLSLETLSRTGDFHGTPNYASPEQCEGLREIDCRTDIYSLGCILYEMLSGSNPFGLSSTATPMQWMYAQVHTPPKPFSSQLNIPVALQALVMRALHKDPRERFSSALEFTNALDQIFM
jgi:serine/threonine protein kinase